jgi:outer membrane lipoprotein-sorting protein
MWRGVIRFLALAALIASATASGVVQAQSVDEVLQKYFQAAGGLEKMKAVQAMRVSGRMAVGPGLEATFVRTAKRPNKVRLEFTVQGVTGIQAYDGETGWMLMPFMGQTQPELMPPDLARSMQEEADFDSPLVDYRAKGHRVELMGRESVEGTPAYKLKVTLKSGDVSFYYLDAEYYLPLRTESKRAFQGQELNVVTSFGDYKEVGGLMMPHAITVTGQGPGVQQLVIERVELNAEVPDEYFRMASKQGGGR